MISSVSLCRLPPRSTSVPDSRLSFSMGSLTVMEDLLFFYSVAWNDFVCHDVHVYNIGTHVLTGQNSGL